MVSAKNLRGHLKSGQIRKRLIRRRNSQIAKKEMKLKEDIETEEADRLAGQPRILAEVVSHSCIDQAPPSPGWGA
jgi:hypothetical protein